MPAWKHSAQKQWNDVYYTEYRKIVAEKAKSYKGRSEDCADLSMMFLMQFAAQEGLPVTFEDNAGTKYRSTSEGMTLGSFKIPWQSTDHFIQHVQRKIGVEALWKHNTVVDPTGPTAGDLLIRWTTKTLSLGGFKAEVEDNHHAALVIRHYNIGVSHPQENANMTNFPGSDAAEQQLNVTEYFRGTVNDKTGATDYRHVDKDVHFDFLNSRSSKKRNAEIIYFANARQLQAEGFQFRMYNAKVLSG